MKRRFERRRNADQIDLDARARRLATQYDLPQPESVRWVDNMTSRWGSCTPADGAIRIASQLAAWPTWVLDYVLVHELAHLAEPGHTPRFHALVARFPNAPPGSSLRRACHRTTERFSVHCSCRSRVTIFHSPSIRLHTSW
jgi:predicted metal-dependent hydrolase